MEWFKSSTKIDVVHVPYKSGTALALVGGEIQAAFPNLPAQLPHIKAGRSRALAVTSLERSKHLPEVPTIAESGVPGYEVVVWLGMCAPARVSKAIMDKLNADFVKVLNMPDLRQRMEQHGFDAASSSPEQFASFIKSETAKWAKDA